MVDRPPIGQVIRAKRKELGHTQADFALLCGITPQYLSLLELGDVNVSLDTLLMICKVLNKPLSVLMATAEDLAKGIVSNSPSSSLSSGATKSSSMSSPTKLPGKTRPTAGKRAKPSTSSRKVEAKGAPPRSGARQVAGKSTTAAKKNSKPLAKSSDPTAAKKSMKPKATPARKRQTVR